MTEKERYKRAFSSIHLPDDFAVDLQRKHREKRIRLKSAITAACLTAALFGGTTAAYASNLNGIQRTIQIWLHGDQTSAVITFNEEEGITRYTVTDENSTEIHGGGVEMENDGSEKAVSEAQMQEYLNEPDMETLNGRTCLFYKDQVIDITDLFDEDGLCYVVLKEDNKELYVTAVKDKGLSAYTKRFIQKEELPEQWFEED